MKKIGLKLWSVNTDYYYKEAEKLYNEGIYDYIELYIVPNTTETLEKWKKLKIPYIIHNPHFAHGFNLANAEKKELNIKIYDEVKKFADKLNAPYIIFHGGVEGNIEQTALQLAELNEPRALIENKPYRAIPNKMGGNFCRGFSPDEIEQVIDTANCGFCLDFGHAICAANSLKKNVYEYIEEFMKLNPDMFHLTDVNDINSEYDSHLHIGSGELDILRVKKLIPDNKCVTLETVKNSKENLNDFISDTDNFRHLSYNNKTK